MTEFAYFISVLGVPFAGSSGGVRTKSVYSPRRQFYKANHHKNRTQPLHRGYEGERSASDKSSIERSSSTANRLSLVARDKGVLRLDVA